MARYIDADKCAKLIRDKFDAPLGLAYSLLADIPTADVVEVVRCKDCKLAKIVTTNIGIKCIECQSHEVYMEANDFCSYGKRKSEETP